MSAERRGFLDRIAAAFVSWKLDFRVGRARRAERVALRVLGGALAGSAAVGRLVDEVRSRGHAEDHLQTALRASVEEDRADFATASARARLFVVVRGVAARAVLRDRLRAARRTREESRERLGKAALDGAANVSREAFVQDALVRARDARARLSALVTERAALLAPFGGSAWPDWMHGGGREISAFAGAFVRVLRGQFIPRLPAVAAAAAGWWVAGIFTESEPIAALHSWGIGHGPRWAVSTETFEAIRFWFPVAAAAICAYLGHRIGTTLRARYAPPALQSRQ
ncbi:MAG: hypothetical protein ACJ79H_18490 [Myxococcales bacterium]